MLIAGKTILHVVNNNFKPAVDKQNLPKAKMENKKLYGIQNQNNRCIGIFSQHGQSHRTMIVIKQLPLFNIIKNLLVLISHFLLLMDELEFNLRKSVIFGKQEST